MIEYTEPGYVPPQASEAIANSDNQQQLLSVGGSIDVVSRPDTDDPTHTQYDGGFDATDGYTDSSEAVIMTEASRHVAGVALDGFSGVGIADAASTPSEPLLPREEVMFEVEDSHHPEVFENDKGTRRLELLGLKEQLRDPADRRSFFAGMTDEDYAKMAHYAGSVAYGEKVDYEYYDGHTTQGETPPLEDKERLMNVVFSAARDIAQNPELDDRTALRDIGLTLGGGTDYVHPRIDGNGRQGRILHYVAEFGSERGDDAVNVELYGVVAKLPVYDTDKKVPIDHMPSDELTGALNRHVLREHEAQGGGELSLRELASKRVEAFADMMRGKVNIPVPFRVSRIYVPFGQTGATVENHPPNTFDGKTLYEKDYVDVSALPHRQPNEVPAHARRVKAAQRQQRKTISISADIV
jgi:hypothetical protein